MSTIEVISPGLQTTVQDYPGRIGYWDVGVPPSGPMDNYAFRLGNQILGNDPTAAGLEITMTGPELLFDNETVVVLTGAPVRMLLNGKPVPQWTAIKINQSSRLKIESIVSGMRAYLCIKNGIKTEPYLGSQSTFTLGQFGGYEGRELKRSDQLQINQFKNTKPCNRIDYNIVPVYNNTWPLHVLYGPQGAPDFFSETDIKTIFETRWKVHYNSNRTGVRLIGPKPEWARKDGGEAGLHPSNLHDNAYTVGTIDFTGDMPVILGTDGPSLGGFVSPATVINADLWKIGQLKPDDTVQFIPVSLQQANQLEQEQQNQIATLKAGKKIHLSSFKPESAVWHKLTFDHERPEVVYRISGDSNILVEYGEMKLDIELRMRVQVLMDWLSENIQQGINNLTPGIRSLQVNYDNNLISTSDLISLLESAEHQLMDIDDIKIPSRIVHLPLSWNDQSTQKAIDIYMQSVRDDAPWCPSNIEFIRRINGLSDHEDVKKILFNASYLVMGLGDVYLGAPVATPLDPRHRLVTTKYNPARTWTPENAVGIGGAYLCIYGMEGPGGYQFVGRTVQMWNRGQNKTDFESDKPWLLRFFDQIRFFPVSEEELIDIRREFPKGNYNLDIQPAVFSFSEYQSFLQANQHDIEQFKKQQQTAFEAERDSWLKTGELT